MFNSNQFVQPTGKFTFVQVVVKTARDLANVDVFSISSPFARIYWNGIFIGQTLVFKNDLSPRWNQKFNLPLPEEVSQPQCCLYVEIWDHSAINHNIFMGSVEVSYTDVMWSVANGAVSAWFPLKRSRFLPPDYRYGKIQGKLELQFGQLSFEDDNAEVPANATLKTEIPELPVTTSVKSLMNDQVLQRYPETSSLYSFYDLLVEKYGYLDGAYIECETLSFHPTLAQEGFFIVTLEGKTILKSRLSELGGWSESPIQFDLQRLRGMYSLIRFYLTVMDSFGRETVVGVLNLSVDSLLLLPSVQTSHLLTKLVPSMCDCSLQLKVSIRHNTWNKILNCDKKTDSIFRRIRIMSGHDLSEVNGSPPNVSCELFVGSLKRFESSDILKSFAPVWNECVVDLSLRMDPALDVSIRVIHRHMHDRICIGVCPIPIDFLIHPPDEPVDLFCLPLSQYPGFKFLVSGSIRCQISTLLPWTIFSRSYNARNALGLGLAFTTTGEITNADDDSNYGTCFEYTSNSFLENDGSVVVVPMGSSVEGVMQTIGLKHKHSCKGAVAATELIDNSLRKCILKLHLMEKLRDLRKANFTAFLSLLDGYVHESDYALDGAHWLFAQSILRCFPSSAVITVSVLKGHSRIEYRYFSEETSMASFVVEQSGDQNQGSTNNFIHPTDHCLVIETFSDLQKRSFVTFEKMSRVIFPRLMIPYRIGDPTAGFFIVERLSQYLGGKSERFMEFENIKVWLSEIGDAFARIISRKEEDLIHAKILQYISRSDSSILGLLHEISSWVLSFITDCRLVEVLSLSDQNILSSVTASQSISKSMPGSTLEIPHIQIIRSAPPSDSGKKLKRLISIDNGDACQHHLMTNNLINRDSWICNKVTVLKMRPDLNLNLRVCDLDDDLSVLQDYSGSLKFNSLAETEVSCNLLDLASSRTAYTAILSCTWHRQKAHETSLNFRDINGFKLTIHSATGLLSKHNRVSPFCEVQWYNEIHHRTTVIQNTTEPNWNETFLLPFTAGPSTLAIDAYDMEFMKKGKFLGRVEIPFNDVCFSSDGKRSLTLSRKSSMPSRLQDSVGGLLTLTVSVVRNDPSDIPPRDLFDEEERDVISVTIFSASGLQRVDIIGSADPFVQGVKSRPSLMCLSVFVLGFIVDEEDPLFTTKIVQDDLNPQWEETFFIDIKGLHKKSSKWPVLYFEVWDYNKLASNKFLGCCYVPPEVYLVEKFKEMALVASPKMNAHQNRSVQGTLSLGFEVDENVNRESAFVQGIRQSGVIAIKRVSLTSMTIFANTSYLLFATVKVGGLVVGSTKASSVRNLNWEEEIFAIDFQRLVTSKSREVQIELYLRNTKTNEVVNLANYSIDPVEVLHPSREDQTRNVQVIFGESDKPFHVNLVFNAKLQSEFERLTLQSVNCDSQIFENSSDENKENLDIYPIAENDGVRSQRRLQRYIDNIYKRSEYYPQDHYRQLIEACVKRSELSLEAFPAEITLIPIPRTVHPGRLNFVIRSPIGKFSNQHRDFILRLSSVVADRIKVIQERIDRAGRLKTLASRLQAIGLRSSDLSGALMACMDEVSATTECFAETYLFEDSNRCTFKRVRSSLSNTKDCDTLPDSLLLQLSIICKLRIQLQMYNREIHVRSFDWSSGSQVNMRSLLSFAKNIDAIAGENFSSKVVASLYADVHDGCFVTPLIAGGEVFYGLFIIRGFDKAPAVTYQIDAPVSILDRKSKIFSAPEEGYNSALQESSSILAQRIMDQMFTQALLSIRSFLIDSDTTCAEVVKHVFQQIFLHCPAIQGLSLWRAHSSLLDEYDDETKRAIPDCIVVGAFTIMAGEAFGVSSSQSRFPGDLRILHYKNRWTLSFPWHLDLPTEINDQQAQRQFMNSFTEFTPRLPPNSMCLCLEEIGRCVGMHFQSFRVHIGHTCVLLGEKKGSVEAYSRLFELPFKVCRRFSFRFVYNCLDTCCLFLETPEH